MSGLVTWTLSAQEAHPKLPGAHILGPCCLPAEWLLPFIGSRNQKPEPVCNSGRHFRLQGGQGLSEEMTFVLALRNEREPVV